MANNRIVIAEPEQHIGKLCHVEGWPRGCVFRLREVNGSEKVLVTPRTGKVYRTNNAITMTRRQIEAKKHKEASHDQQ